MIIFLAFLQAEPVPETGPKSAVPYPGTSIIATCLLESLFLPIILLQNEQEICDFMVWALLACMAKSTQSWVKIGWLL